MIYVTSALISIGWLSVQWRLANQHPQLFARRCLEDKPIAPGDRKLMLSLQLSVCATFFLSGSHHQPMPSPLAWGTGLALVLSGTGILWRSVDANPFFEGLVRHQPEAGHQPVDCGPYRVVRHPGYLGFGVLMASVPVLLSSNWGWAGWLLILMLLLVRINLEEKWLTSHLPDYPAYRQRVPSRLIPKLW